MPFQYTPYQNRYVGSIADLMGRGRDAEAQALITAANAQAQAAQASGQAWGGAIQGIGNTIAAIPGQMQAQQDRKLALEDRALERAERQGNIDYTAARTGALEAQDVRSVSEAARAAEREIRLKSVLGNPDGYTWEDIVGVVGPEKGIEIATGLASLQVDPPEPLSLEDRSTHLRNIMRGFNALSPEMQIEQWPAVRARALANTALGLNPADIPVEFDPAWFTQMLNFGVEPTAPVPPGPPVELSLDGQPTVFERDSGGTLVPIGGGVGPRIDERPSGSLVPVRDAAGNLVYGEREAGQPVLEPTGRAITSGDAGRISELDTSLDDIAVLSRTLFPDAIGDDIETEATTGTRAAIGAALPNWFTEITGVGEESKGRQAVIDRVKQVIGKALEGGVLRKEDEYKYTKILPTIQDTPEVAKVKLDGLKDALILRRERLLESLDDAGYDVSEFYARGGGAGRPASGVEMIAPDGERLMVSPEDAAHYERRGATRVR
jgi:hypothetical protein